MGACPCLRVKLPTVAAFLFAKVTWIVLLAWNFWAAVGMKVQEASPLPPTGPPVVNGEPASVLVNVGYAAPGRCRSTSLLREPGDKRFDKRRVISTFGLRQMPAQRRRTIQNALWTVLLETPPEVFV